MLTATIETTTHLTDGEYALAGELRAIAAHAADLDDAERQLRARAPAWFVYRGGSHIAVHLARGCDRRVLLVRPVAPAYSELHAALAMVAFAFWLYRDGDVDHYYDRDGHVVGVRVVDEGTEGASRVMAEEDATTQGTEGAGEPATIMPDDAAPAGRRRRVEVDASSYERTHGRAPRGTGSWAFFIGDAGEPWWVHGSSYGAAKAAAIAEARARGARRVVVGP